MPFQFTDMSHDGSLHGPSALRFADFEFSRRACPRCAYSRWRDEYALGRATLILIRPSKLQHRDILPAWLAASLSLLRLMPDFMISLLRPLISSSSFKHCMSDHNFTPLSLLLLPLTCNVKLHGARSFIRDVACVVNSPIRI